MRSRSRLTAVLVLAPLLLTACGSDEQPAAGAPSGAQETATASITPTPTPRASASPAPVSVGEEYVDDDGFAVTFPAGWTVRQDIAGLQVAGTLPGQTDPDFADNVGVVLEDTGQAAATVAQYLDASVENAPQQIQGFRLVERDDATGTLEFTGDLGRKLHFLARVVVKDGKAYTATFTATEQTYARGLPTATSVLRTLRAT